MSKLHVAISTAICTIVGDVLVLLTTWSKTYATVRDAWRNNIRSPLATALLKDGTLHFIFLLLLKILNIAGIWTDVFAYLGTDLLPPLTSIIISHFLLNLRQAADEIQGVGSQMSRPSFVCSQTPSVRFMSFVDNIGEELVYGSEEPNTDPNAASGHDENDMEHSRGDPFPVEGDPEQGGVVNLLPQAAAI
ncbi:hypothetical protein OBBRIDRAFT_180490 [Obba rivulosa]|uniref:Uncharacterized protein n=1 Tax=Obba rivulosa TaxID=1052685 RepID=A0A8E2J3T7_9APHY|nr:hypothetical protein OBBRIDRAFT_180490 [Obba rivulosa]